MIQATLSVKGKTFKVEVRRKKKKPAKAVETLKRYERGRTPPALFRWIRQRWPVVVDLAADEENHLCEDWFDEEDDALSQNWSRYISQYHTKCKPGQPHVQHYGFVNAPYERGQLERWFAKAAAEASKGAIGIVMLVPAFNGEHRWKEHVFGKAKQVWAIDGRLRFGDSDTGVQGKPAPFGSMLIVWEPYNPTDQITTEIHSLSSLIF